MRKRLISKDEYNKIVEFQTIPEVAEYLKEHANYSNVFKDIDVTQVHRETVEYAIFYSAYHDFDKMYKVQKFCRFIFKFL